MGTQIINSKKHNNGSKDMSPLYISFSINRIIYALILCGLSQFMVGCSNDKDIKADLYTKSKDDINFAGVNFFVKDKVVTLTGYCPTNDTKQKVEQTVKKINIIKGMNDQIIISPVTLSNAFPLKQEVDSVLSQYAAVNANVTDSAVTLTGNVDKKGLDKLIPAINALHPVKLNNQLNIQ